MHARLTPGRVGSVAEVTLQAAGVHGPEPVTDANNPVQFPPQESSEQGSQASQQPPVFCIPTVFRSVAQVYPQQLLLLVSLGHMPQLSTLTAQLGPIHPVPQSG